MVKENEFGWVAVDGHGREFMFSKKPYKSFPCMDLEVMWGQAWVVDSIDSPYGVLLPNGTIEKLIGRKLTYSDEPVQLK